MDPCLGAFVVGIVSYVSVRYHLKYAATTDSKSIELDIGSMPWLESIAMPEGKCPLMVLYTRN